MSRSRGRRSLPPRVLDIDAPQHSLQFPDDDDDADAGTAAAAASGAKRPPLTAGQEDLLRRLRVYSFRGSEAFVRRVPGAVLRSVLDEMDGAPVEEAMAWRNPGALINHLVTEALGGSRSGVDHNERTEAGSAQSRSAGRGAGGRKEGRDRRRRRAS